MADDQQYSADSDSSVEEAAQQGPLPEDPEQAEHDGTTREDIENAEGVIPKNDNDLDPDRDLDPAQRERAIAQDETVGGIFQPGGRGG